MGASEGASSCSCADALLVPKAIAVVKCTAHQTPHDEVTHGNALADSAAKAAALSAPQAEYTCALIEQPPLASLEDLAKIQEAAPAAEKRFWSANGCILHPDHLWRAPAGRLVAPKMLMPYLARVYHGMAHVSKGGMVAAVNRDWCAFGFPVIAHHYCQQCVICQQHNIGKAVKVRQAAHPPPWGPFVNIQIDFIQLSKCCGYEYVLVLVDVFSNWVEAFPCRKADARTVVKLLLKDFVPRFGIPVSINSDRGPSAKDCLGSMLERPFPSPVNYQHCCEVPRTAHLDPCFALQKDPSAWRGFSSC
ncbi:uncharacterized protein LOC128843680 isoform X2 [Malaclemys terrapin pileata]|uniref:uncharacterized protein LOC128843680 isoform X2 n=1 Tax=Malaclemys terrapin pileata TaxID=2991368 RepID=UPI0023A7D23A|nr:uncharacterized protein LOC128843680 isoform X2 [Malaclemys terrapin pileata]